MPGKVRNPNIELLRIVSMLMIVILHFLMHGQILKWSAFGSKEYAIYWMIEAFVFVSVNAFVLISGYFLCLSEFKSFKTHENMVPSTVLLNYMHNMLYGGRGGISKKFV